MAVDYKKLFITHYVDDLAHLAASEKTELQNLSVNYLSVENAAINYLKVTDADIKFATIDNLTAVNAEIQHIQANYIAADVIASKYLSSEFASVTNAHIELGAITSALIEDGAIDTVQIADGSITDGKIVNLTANKINAGTLSVDRLIIRDTVNPEQSLVYQINNIDGALQSVRGDTLNGEIITERSITADRIVAASITSNEIAANSITSNKILAGAVTAGKLNVDTLSAVSGKLGTVTAGTISGTTITGGSISGTTITSTAGNIGGWKIGNGYLDHVGTGRRLRFSTIDTYSIYAGVDGSNWNFIVNKDGTIQARNADITGKITATSGSFTGSITSTNANITGGTINISTTNDKTNVIKLNSSRMSTALSPHSLLLKNINADFPGQEVEVQSHAIYFRKNGVLTNYIDGSGVLLATGTVQGATLQATGTVHGANLQTTGTVYGATLQATGTVKGATLQSTGFLYSHGDKRALTMYYCAAGRISLTTVWQSFSFGRTLGHTPIMSITPNTSNTGVISGKVRNITTTGFEACIGGSGIGTTTFDYLALNT